MAVYKCMICGHIYDESKEKIKFEDLPDTWVCPKCKVGKELFQKVETETETIEEKGGQKKFVNAIEILKDNVAIEKEESLCIDCGMCKNICKKRENIKDICEGRACVNCGQCIQVCPTGALRAKNDKEKLKEMLSSKICIAYTSPSVRVAVGDEFGMEKGTFAQGKLVSALRKLGFKYVLDVTFGADLTIMEEASELIERIKNNGKLPMFTSCCPAWIKYAEQYYPTILENISTCKSPIGMQGEIVKNYFVKKYNLKKEQVYTVAITPCTAKKYEIKRKEIEGTDLVITIKELSDMIKEENIDFQALEDSQYDSLLGEGSGAGMIFGNTGGVMEAAIRTAHYMITDQELEPNKLKLSEVRGMENVKEGKININGLELNIAVVHSMASAIPILEDVKNGNSKYQYIEIMNCFGGCIGGGGQPKIKMQEETEIKKKRINSLYQKDEESKMRCSHQNKDIIKVYDEFLEKPLSDKAEELLHTHYIDKSKIDTY